MLLLLARGDHLTGGAVRVALHLSDNPPGPAIGAAEWEWRNSASLYGASNLAMTHSSASAAFFHSCHAGSDMTAFM